ncbi:MAG: hypothetical protein NT159_07480 [Proteobacteria bacterium]|nr:hypothetical protein [Pseudomonadota bacterium]
MRTLVVDTGQDIVGIFCVEDKRYIPYRASDIPSAIEQIREEDEVVTYNGKHHDLEELGKFAGMPAGQELPLAGIHTDIRSICWSDRIWGSSLRNTYSIHFTELPDFPDTHEGSNELDVFMTFKLWELWKEGRLKIQDGQDVIPSAP